MILDELCLLPASSSTMYVEPSFSENAARKLRLATKANIGKQLDVFINRKLLYAEPITAETENVQVKYIHGSKNHWMQYFFGLWQSGPRCFAFY